MIDVVQYEKGDVYLLQPKDIYDGDATVQQRTELVASNPSSRTFTLKSNGKPIAVLGCTPCVGKTWELWAVMGVEINHSKIEFSKICRRLLESSAEVFGVKRFQSLCMDKFKDGERWFKFLGFQKEGTLRQFGEDGQDYHLYARLF